MWPTQEIPIVPWKIQAQSLDREEKLNPRNKSLSPSTYSWPLQRRFCFPLIHILTKLTLGGQTCKPPWESAARPQQASSGPTHSPRSLLPQGFSELQPVLCQPQSHPDLRAIPKASTTLLQGADSCQSVIIGHHGWKAGLSLTLTGWVPGLARGCGSMALCQPRQAHLLDAKVHTEWSRLQSSWLQQALCVFG